MVEALGSGFDRVRVGVGRPLATQDTADYVLEPLSLSELQGMGDVVERASDAIECLLTDGLQQAMNRFNVRRSELADESTLDAARRSPCGDTRH